MRIDLEPIGIIKKSGQYSKILIYSKFEQIVKNLIKKIDEGKEKRQKLLVILKNKNPNDGHQIQISNTTIINREGNIFKVDKIDANGEPIIDIRCL